MKTRTSWLALPALIGVALLVLGGPGCGGEEESPPAEGSSSAAVAGPDQPPPPKEALDACAGLDPGAECTLSVEGMSLEGKCLGDPLGEGPLACVPPAPEEALDACASLDEGAACSFVLAGKSVSGVCHQGPPDKDQPPLLACAPGPKPE